MKLYTKTYYSMDAYEADEPEYRYDTAYIVKKGGWTDCDMETECATYKTAIKRFFRAIDPEGKGVGYGRWTADMLIESCDNGCFAQNDGMMADGTKNPLPSFYWSVEELDDGVWYIFLNALDDPTVPAFELGKPSNMTDTEKEQAMHDDIKTWYHGEFPTDDCWTNMLDGKTFWDLFDALDHHRDVYKAALGEFADTLIRERCFSRLADLMSCDYDYIYSQWLSC